MLLVNVHYQFKSEEALQKYADICEHNKRTAAIVGLKPFKILDCSLNRARRWCSVACHASVEGNDYFFITFNAQDFHLINELK
ncbi:hypothetical protein PP428_gp069 [Escherichia phage vB_EcoM_RZ]|uniref:Uncharacterized protein n=2 Tax=Gaprivervirus TaxID=1913654 RepID=E3SFD0_BPSP8|nr:goF mRNA metabolism modulator [Shigella phage SP18]YP_010650906.1 hypothetical protein PP428_gp069 [Escherichia phage vB_EcoM_RZ]QMP18608.1 hypothetical protein CJ20_012 [Escherichia phage CJ20]QWQ55811.1 hypothetical protein [Escherichia phage P479]UHS65259.1 hypothetical protein [Escherichia phage P896]ADO19383.1 hypothetical protein SP18gp041 [Shigella phage SP18]UGL59885.1 hypothetical protein [Escherichia phage vB_EcoM_RZ]